VENKLTGRIPAFAYAGELSPRSHKLVGFWPRNRIILNFIKKMQILLGDQAGRLQELVQGTNAWNVTSCKRNLMASVPPLSREQLAGGLSDFARPPRRWAVDHG